MKQNTRENRKRAVIAFSRMKNDRNHLDMSGYLSLATLYNMNVAFLLSQDADELFQDQEAYNEAIKRQIEEYDKLIRDIRVALLKERVISNQFSNTYV